MLDVRDPDAITALAAELGEVDIVFSNATSRMRPEADPAAEVDAVAETNNLADHARAAGLRPADATGRQADHRRQRARDARQARRQRSAPVRGRRRRASTPSTRWSNSGAPPSRPGAPPRGLRHVAEHPVEGRPGRRRPRDRPRTPSGRPRAGCPHRRAVPGLIDTDASRPWFADMSSAQTPEQAAAWPLELVLGLERSTRRSTGSSSSSAGCCPGRQGSPWRTGAVA